MCYIGSYTFVFLILIKASINSIFKTIVLIRIFHFFVNINFYFLQISKDKLMFPERLFSKIGEYKKFVLNQTFYLVIDAPQKNMIIFIKKCF